MIENIALHAMQQEDISKYFKVSRNGKDRDKTFWTFGKIHGLENIAFADAQEVKDSNGNPVRL